MPRVLLGLFLLSVATVSVASSTPARSESTAPRLLGLRVSSGQPFAGDRRLLATVSPNGDGVRDRAVVRFRLERAATVALHVVVCGKHPKVVASKKAHFGPGRHHLDWVPKRSALPQTYLLRLTVRAHGARRVYGSVDHRRARAQPAPVVRVVGIDAGFTQRSYSPGAVARLRLATDVTSFALQLFQAGPETEPTRRSAIEGVPASGSPTLPRCRPRDTARVPSVHVGGA